MPDVLYSQSQRWGSAVPSPHASVWKGRPISSMGVVYQADIPPLLDPLPLPDPSSPVVAVATASAAAAPAADFVAADDQRLYYCGDFCSSSRAPGFEAAALSALDAATHIIQELCPSATFSL